MDKTLKIRRFRQNLQRPVVKASLGAHVSGASLPHPCPGDTATTAAGAAYRVGREIKRPPNFRAEFRQFVTDWLEKNMTPLSVETDTSFQTWINGTPYTLARKEELRRKLEESGLDLKKEVPAKYLRCKSFMKDESYPTWKHARAINSRSDEFKALVGPIFQAISDKLFALPWFIKKIPINERPQYIIDHLLRTAEYYVTSDYTSFEAHFTKELQEDCELLFHQYMVKNIAEGDAWLKLIKMAKTGMNVLEFKNFIIELEAKRMSGEMDTSLSNGFSNLLFMLFLMFKAGCTNVKGVIEGDDGLFVCTGNPPNPELFEQFGLTIKMEKTNDLNHASFCGMVFDLDDRTNVTNPIEELVSFGWTTAQYARSKPSVHMNLIRAKALSLAYQYPACPILTKLAYKMCQLTASYDSAAFVKKNSSRAFNLYELEMVMKAHEYFDKNKLNREPGVRTRLLVEQLYGVTTADQIKIENYIDSLEKIQPLKCPVIDKYLDKSWVDYYSTYTTYTRTKSKLIDDAGMVWPRLRQPFNHTNLM